MRQDNAFVGRDDEMSEVERSPRMRRLQFTMQVMRKPHLTFRDGQWLCLWWTHTAWGRSPTEAHQKIAAIKALYEPRRNKQ